MTKLTYNLGPCLGKGAMGIVYQATLSDGRPVAVKRQKPGTPTIKLRREAAVLTRLHHRNIVQFYALQPRSEQDHGLFTQQARFDDNSTSEATTMRTLLGGVVHFGDKIVPYLRGGLGIRLTDYTSSSAEDVGLKGSSLLRFGGGVDAWIGKNFTVGIAGHYVGAQGAGTDESFSIEGGIHAGYAWNP